MNDYRINKNKILNDPVFGFIRIPDDLIFDILEHPWFQRLRRIKQLGLTYLVYPGALHTRFHHAIGAMGLMQEALKVLQEKGHQVTEQEKNGVLIAILLHDIGHGPFSHALEHSIVENGNHEDLSLLFMEQLNRQFDGQLQTAIEIFKNEYPKKFLHQLISGQLDVDRLDYLKRDSFFTGVSEGVIGTERIIKMLNIVDDELVIEAKGIYSIEKFILARRLMYWQVYLHKTVLSAEQMLVKVLQRAKYLSRQGEDLFATPDLKFFLNNEVAYHDVVDHPELLSRYAELDDFDIAAALKGWKNHKDKILSDFSGYILNRQLFRLELQNSPFDDGLIRSLQKKWKNQNPGLENLIDYYVFLGTTENNAYNPEVENIKVLLKGGKLEDLTNTSEELNVSMITQTIHKNYICYPKALVL